MTGRTLARRSAGAVAGALLLSSVILAQTANAVSTCTYDPASATVAVQIGSGETAALAVDDDGVDLVDSAPGSIVLRQGEGPYDNCGSATNGNTSRIAVFGQEGSSETFTIDEAIGAAFATSIGWSIALGSGEADTFTITASEDVDNDIAFPGDAFTLNGGGGGLPGVELVEVAGNIGNDRVDASGRSNTTRLSGGDGFDTLIGGTANDVLSGGDDDDRLLGGDGDDVLDGGPNVDTLYGAHGADTCILDDLRLPCDPSIGVDPSNADPGGSLTVTGAGWYPENGAVGFTLDPSGDASFTALAPDPQTWSIDGTAVAPSAADTYAVTACQPCTDQAADLAPASLIVAGATVEPPATTLELDPSEGSPGDLITVVGEGWDRANGKVRIFVDPSSSQADPDAVSRRPDGGSFEVELEIPDLEDGSYTVLACQHCNRRSRVEQTTTLTVAGAAPAWPPWVWILLGVLVVGAIVAAVVGGNRLRDARLRRRIHTRPRFADPEVDPVTEEPDGSLRHRVGVIPHTDAGVQRVSEGSAHD